jgi:hypothetical protein
MILTVVHAQAGTDARTRALAEELSASQDALHALRSLKQEDVRQKDAAAQQAKRWLDQAQGQLQNTQTALTVKEAEVKTLSSQLDQAAADYATLRVSFKLHSLCDDVSLIHVSIPQRSLYPQC